MITNTFLEKTTDFADQAATAADHAVKATQQLANEALTSVRGTTHQLRTKAQDASESTVSYIKHEPLKSVLIAAATGAALMGLISLMSRSNGR